jgi:hypothetical protein
MIPQTTVRMPSLNDKPRPLQNSQDEDPLPTTLPSETLHINDSSCKQTRKGASK